MEQTQYGFYRLRDDLTFYLASTPPDHLDAQVLTTIFDRYQTIRDQLGNRWIEARRSSP